MIVIGFVWIFSIKGVFECMIYVGFRCWVCKICFVLSVIFILWLIIFLRLLKRLFGVWVLCGISVIFLGVIILFLVRDWVRLMIIGLVVGLWFVDVVMLV